MSDRMIQVLPAPPGKWVHVYAGKPKRGKPTFFSDDVVFFALVGSEDEEGEDDGGRFVVPLHSEEGLWFTNEENPAPNYIGFMTRADFSKLRRRSRRRVENE